LARRLLDLKEFPYLAKAYRLWHSHYGICHAVCLLLEDISDLPHLQISLHNYALHVPVAMGTL
jgi:hypothetical protein